MMLMNCTGCFGAPFGLSLSAVGGLLFQHVPLALIILYAFTTEEKS